MITLSPEAQHKAVELTRTAATEVEYWPTLDPTAVEGSREQRLAAYRGRAGRRFMARIRGRFCGHDGPADTLKRLDFRRFLCHISAPLTRFRDAHFRGSMAKEELLEFEGTVSELLPNATFRVHAAERP